MSVKRRISELEWRQKGRRLLPILAVFLDDDGNRHLDGKNGPAITLEDMEELGQNHIIFLVSYDREVKRN
jgi:hypothetical protein